MQNSLTGEKKKDEAYSAARSRGLNLFSSRKVQEVDGMEKLYREFFNEKAEALCRNAKYNAWKVGY